MKGYKRVDYNRPERKLQYSLNALEYPKVLAQLEFFAMSAPGRDLCLALRPSDERREVERRLEETADMIAYILEYSELGLSGIDEIRPVVLNAEREILPTFRELLRLGRFLRVVRELKKRLPDPQGENYAAEMRRPIFRNLAALAPLAELLHDIETKVASEDDLADDATPELRSIRRRLIHTQDEIKIVLERLVRNSGDKLQDALVTLRNGRYVLPVKAQHKGSVKGLVHDASASGQTLFIEPMAVVELNNEIRELEIEEKKEIERILKEFMGRIVGVRDSLIANAELMAELDFIQAKARLALDRKAFVPQLNDAHRIVLKNARHPLIPKNEVVPIDFELGTEFSTLLITGPNTGGKTVSLKTCGLLTLMALAGLAIPADEGSEIAMFEEVLADIGDEQSIEQSLSTFSSHLKQLITMLEVAGPDSLVLCDELGSGTDPSEGAALAIAILDAFREKGASVVATTHYQELKGYALNTAGVSNACCEFDTETLRPTYRLLIGVPGVSNALAIAYRLGLEPQIIDHARALISDEGQRFEELISAIEQSKQHAEKMEAEIARLHDEAKELEERLKAREAEIKHSEKVKMQEAEEKALEILQQTEREIADEVARKEAELEAFREQAARDAADEKLREQELSSLRGLKSRVKKQADDKADRLGKQRLEKSVKRKLEPADIVIGDYYRAPALNFTGQAVEEPDRKGQVLLEKGQVRLAVPVAGLELAAPPQKPQQKSTRQTRQLRSQVAASARSEIKLIGMRVDEALQTLDDAIDRAQMSGLTTLRVVHGKGSGALRSAVRSRAAQDRRVKDFREAEFGEGDSGVTYLELR